MINLKSNNISKFEVINSLQNLESLELSSNHLSNFRFNTELFNLKSLLLDNNKLNEIKIEKSIESLEILDISNNYFRHSKILKNFPNIFNLNLSFNKFEDLSEIIQIIKNNKFLKEIVLIENCFNKNLYNLEILNADNYECLFDYFKAVESFEKLENKKLINEYRANLIVKTPSLTKIDYIAISELERGLVVKTMQETIINGNKFTPLDKKKNNFLSDLSDCTDNKNSKKIEKSQDDKIKIEKNNKFDSKEKEAKIKFKTKSFKEEPNVDLTSELNYNYNIKVEQPKERERNRDFDYNMNNLNKLPYKVTDVDKDNQTSQHMKEKRNIYKILKRTYARICDRNGYMSFSSFKNLTLDVTQIYTEIEKNLKELIHDVNKLIKNSIFPNRIHLHDLSNILKSEKYSPMFDIIANRFFANQNTSVGNLSLSSAASNVSIYNTCVNKNYSINYNNNNNDVTTKYEKKEKVNKNLEMLTSLDLVPEDKMYVNQCRDVKIKSNYNENVILNRNKREPEMRQEVKTVRKGNVEKNYDDKIFNDRSNKGTEKYEKKDKNNDNFSKTEKYSNKPKTPPKKIQGSPFLYNQPLHKTLKQQTKEEENLLILSNYDNNITPDLSDKNFLRKFLFYIMNPPKQIKYEEYSNILKYEVEENKKEYKFLKHFLVNFSIENFKLIKLFCVEYFNTLFNNYISFEFIHENNILIFYSEYMENLEYSKKDLLFNYENKKFENTQLILEESPIKILEKSQSSNIVMSIMIQSNYNRHILEKR